MSADSTLVPIEGIRRKDLYKQMEALKIPKRFYGHKIEKLETDQLAGNFLTISAGVAAIVSLIVLKVLFKSDWTQLRLVGLPIVTGLAAIGALGLKYSAMMYYFKKSSMNVKLNDIQLKEECDTTTQRIDKEREIHSEKVRMLQTHAKKDKA